MDEGKVDDVKKRKKNKHAISESEWPERIREALLLQVNTRMNPGNASVSLAYGVRAPKIFMRKSKMELLKELRAAYSHEVVPSVVALLTHIPKNYMHAKEADRENNVCVKHSNLEHIVLGLRPYVPSLPATSREIASLVMCPASDSNVIDLMAPLTWNRKCALRSETTNDW
jgi:hypothetical protein